MLRKSRKIASLSMELQKNLGTREVNVALDFIREEQNSDRYPNGNLHKAELTLT